VIPTLRNTNLAVGRPTFRMVRRNPPRLIMRLGARHTVERATNHMINRGYDEGYDGYASAASAATSHASSMRERSAVTTRNSSSSNVILA